MSEFPETLNALIAKKTGENLKPGPTLKVARAQAVRLGVQTIINALAQRAFWSMVKTKNILICASDVAREEGEEDFARELRAAARSLTASISIRETGKQLNSKRHDSGKKTRSNRGKKRTKKPFEKRQPKGNICIPVSHYEPDNSVNTFDKPFLSSDDCGRGSCKRLSLDTIGGWRLEVSGQKNGEPIASTLQVKIYRESILTETMIVPNATSEVKKIKDKEKKAFNKLNTSCKNG